jgi:hypothetical protein
MLAHVSTWPTVLVSGIVGAGGILAGGALTHWLTGRENRRKRVSDVVSEYASKAGGTKTAVDRVVNPLPGASADDRAKALKDAYWLLGELKTRWWAVHLHVGAAGTDDEPIKGLTSIADAATRHLEGALTAAEATDSEARQRAATALDDAERDITSFNDTARGLI